ncbi:MAG TPA: CAP domain-containing protein [Patescibacteria group bacterium]|nr:CAP domain-containing protein [Patescibacteria group bacterium]
MTANPLHLFLPHAHNNHKAKLLHHQSLLVLLGIFIMAQSALTLFHGVRPGVLGYASQISPTAVIELTNQKRIAEGQLPLKENKALDEAAAAKAASMIAQNYWAHNAPNGTEPWSFILNSGYSYLHAGENLARDFQSPGDVVEAWMKSSSHKANLISSKYQDIGVAVIDGKINGVETTLVVQMFGTLQSAAPTVTSEKTSLVKQVLAQESVQAPLPKIQLSPFDVSRSISLAFVILIVTVLAFDWLIVWRRNLIRISGKNWAHLTYFLTLLIILVLLKQGLIL